MEPDDKLDTELQQRAKEFDDFDFEGAIREIEWERFKNDPVGFMRERRLEAMESQIQTLLARVETLEYSNEKLLKRIEVLGRRNMVRR